MLEHLARLGYASKAVIYAIIGLLAILTAANRGGMITDTAGALRVVLTQPFGRTLLIVLAVGLCGYGAWRLLDAVVDPDREGTSAGGLVTRIGNAVRGFVYGALGVRAIQLQQGLRTSSGDEAELWTGRLLEVPFGAVAVGIVGGIVAAYGVSQIVQGATGKHDQKIDWSPIPPGVRRLVQRVSQFGVATRGGLLVTLGVFLVRAAFTHDPNQAAGARESLLRLGGMFEGRWFPAVIAAGVLAYAVDQAVHARCRRIRPVV
jgi:hypothetical protein